MAAQLDGRGVRLDLILPPDRGDLLGILHRQGQVLSTEYTEEGGTRVRAILPAKATTPFAPFRVEEVLSALPVPPPASAPAEKVFLGT